MSALIGFKPASLLQHQLRADVAHGSNPVFDPFWPCPIRSQTGHEIKSLVAAMCQNTMHRSN
jgi:hypothetical protein